jgi:O-succinylbenzoic acid--CoA ligase
VNLIPDIDPKSVALISAEHSLTYSSYFAAIWDAAYKLQNRGIFSGDRVAILSENQIAYPIIFFALIKLGAVAVPINTRFPEAQILDSLAKIDCSKIILSSDFSIYKFGDLETISTDTLISLDASDNYSLDTDFLTDYSNYDASIIFTSGSSGNPKAVLHTLGNHLYSAEGSNENIEYLLDDSWLVALPLYHVGGISILFRAILSGTTVILSDANKSLIDNINQHKPTHVSLVSAQLTELINDKNAVNVLQKMKAILLGGSAVPQALIEKSHALNLKIYTTYGSTEMSSQVTTTAPGDSLDRLYTSGKLLNHREMKIADDGEILVRGDTLFRGYIENGMIDPARDPEGFFHTDDIGKIDEFGCLNVVGRKDNMFISGGENIQPEEIEDALLKIEGVADAAVVPIPDAQYGFRPIAFIKLEDSPFSIKELPGILSEKIAKYKIPVAFIDYPKDMKQLGIKIDRTELVKYALKYFANREA